MIFGVTFYATAADVVKDEGFGNNLNTISTESGYLQIENPQEGLSAYAGSLIAFTGALGVFILIQIFLASYEYMTAKGNEEKVISAKHRIRNVIIAAIILVGGYLLASIVLRWGIVFTGYGQ